jgi:hypothetical protein
MDGHVVDERLTRTGNVAPIAGLTDQSLGRGRRLEANLDRSRRIAARDLTDEFGAIGGTVEDKTHVGTSGG